MKNKYIYTKSLSVTFAVMTLFGCQKPLQTPVPPSPLPFSPTTYRIIPATDTPVNTAISTDTPTPVKEDASAIPSETASPPPSGEILFDDFSYQDQQSMTDNGWIIRDKAGWPGVPGAIWPKENITFIDDPDQPGNYLLQMLSSTDGTASGIQQTQICHQRKYLDGTYATRLFFTDQPLIGPDGDQIVETFYLISPLIAPLDPDYSELDNEYVPNGGWNYTNHAFAVTSWGTVQIEPWIAENATFTKQEVMPGWHTIVMQVLNGKINYFLDGQLITYHSGKYYPEVPMSINYNLWFVNGGLLNSSETRQYNELVDWVYFEANVDLNPNDVDAQINSLRDAAVQFQDTVPERSPALPSLCDM